MMHKTENFHFFPKIRLLMIRCGIPNIQFSFLYFTWGYRLIRCVYFFFLRVFEDIS